MAIEGSHRRRPPGTSTVVDVFDRDVEIGWTSVRDVLVFEIGEPKSIRRMEPEVITSIHAAHDRILVLGGRRV